ncbi:ribonuclease H-like domain-containing protein [Chloroflexota bacterium]
MISNRHSLGCQKGTRIHTDAYLDIETTGLSWLESEITVIGVYLVNGTESRVVQLVGRDVTVDNLREAIDGVSSIYTYNGSRFDLPFIHSSLGINLNDIFHHHDLMYDCWRCNLKGGFKAVEQQLGIPRRLQGISGWDAVLLWQRYQYYNDREALATLLKYNEEDVVNLKALRERLHRFKRES